MSFKKKTRAKTDRHQLYQESVQNPDFEVKFLRRVFRSIRNRDATKLREDFCGTAFLSCEWVRRVPEGVAVGIDLDATTLEYAKKYNIPRLGKRASRVKLVRGDVLEASGFTPDVVAAYNFSYFVFKKRSVILKYFKRVHRTLAKDGIFFLDIYGGPEAQVVQEESTPQNRFSYVWDQAHYNPITGETLCHIHFDLADGTRLKKAFTYDWRLWTIPEIKDLLYEAGFQNADTYWEGTDNATGSGNGVFRRSLKGDSSAGWIAYLVAPK